MLRIGEIVKEDKNPLMVVSMEYEEIIKKLAVYNYSSKETEFLGCLIISQTEHQYKKYLIRVLIQLKELKIDSLIKDWQNNNFEINDEELKPFFSQDEYIFLKNKNIEEDLQKFKSQYPSLLEDNLNDAFYHTKKKGMIYLRRLILFYIRDSFRLNNFQKLILHFVAAQMLHSWESSCINLGMMIMNNWDIDKMSRWFCKIWPIYKNK